MRRRLLELCLLAYPRGRRERDRDYLRDLALDLSEVGGPWRQALSLVRGGLGERINALRSRAGAGASSWRAPAVTVCGVLAVLALAVSSLVGPSASLGERAEVEQFTCASTDHAACADAKSRVAARRRDGWDCATLRDTQRAQRLLTVRCTL